MKKKRSRSKVRINVTLLFCIIIVFAVFGVVVFSVSRKISKEMSDSAIQNLSESLELIKETTEVILTKEAEFQRLIAQEITMMEDPEAFIRSYNKNETMVKLSLIFSGETEGVSNTGERFTEEELDFTLGRTVDGLPLSASYVNYMGTWAYSMKCPVEKDGETIAELYVEYIYDVLEKSLPNGFYNGKAILYVMDTESERLVLKPRGMGERGAGHLNLEDFYRANNIVEEDLKSEVSECVANGKNILFYHDIRGQNALCYMWSVNEGALYLIGYVPIEAIQQEGKSVNQNILIVIIVMLIAFFLCCMLFYLTRRQQEKIRREQEAERELHEKQLAEALQAAQIASKSKTMFLSNMSHDIRTPMNVVLGFTTLLAMDAENPAKVREYTKKIMASGQHLLSLINDVLDVSKIESGKVALTIEAFTLNSLVSSVDAIIRPMAKDKKQHFYVEIADIEHEYLMGDETRIKQVLINLLSNAVKYTQEGGNIWFRMIGLKQRSNQFEHIRIEVEDDGYGMTPEYLKTIFDAFTRAENSTTNKVQGTGLGMAITKNIVELMGGTIDVSSEEGKGSIFCVEIELRIPEGQEDKQFWVKHDIKKILAVNGNIEDARTMQMLMKDTGVLTDTASNTKEAAGLLQDAHAAGETYQIVIVNWDIVEAEGFSSAEKLRNAADDMVFIFFLITDEAVGVEQALQMNHTDILIKPFFVSALKEKIMEMQAGKSDGNTAEETSIQTLEGLHFLAAEDNEINAEILTEILSIEGATCEVEENGQKALERFSNAAAGEFDAILMDVQMPVMNGYDATRAIRELEREDAKDILIIAMTANAFAEDEKEALASGMNVHLTKPIDIEALKQVIKQYLQ